jgi:hypothetical protein
VYFILAACRSGSRPGSHARLSALKPTKSAAWELPPLGSPTSC